MLFNFFEQIPIHHSAEVRVTVVCQASYGERDPTEMQYLMFIRRRDPGDNRGETEPPISVVNGVAHCANTGNTGTLNVLVIFQVPIAIGFRL